MYVNDQLIVIVIRRRRRVGPSEVPNYYRTEILITK